MYRLLSLLAAFALATPAAAQRPDLPALLTKWGFPPAALTIFSGSMEDAARLLGPPVTDRMESNRWGGPDHRGLGFRTRSGAVLTLYLCTDDERAERGIDPSRTFCEMSVVLPTVPGQDIMARQIAMNDTLAAAAPHPRGGADTEYFVFGDVMVHIEGLCGLTAQTIIVLDLVPPAWHGQPPGRP